VTAEHSHRVRPWFWFFLNLPFGATSGFVQVTLAYVLKGYGVSDAKIAGLIALNTLPHTWKFFWSPIADTTLSRKTWYRIANAFSSATILAIAFVPITRPPYTWDWHSWLVPGNVPALLGTFIFINSLSITVLGMAVEGLMAHSTPPEQRGRAAGWFQGGNLGGAGLGGGLALLIAEYTSTRVALIVLAVILFGCQLMLRFVPEAPRVTAEGTLAKRKTFNEAMGEFFGALKAVFKDLRAMLWSRRGIIGLTICFLPIGSGAAQGLFSALAGRWNASAELVAITTGMLGGVISMLGCLAGGWVSDKLGRRVAYAVSGAFLAVVAIGMGLAPRNEYTYVFFTLTYAAGTGVSYACFTGLVLDIIGTGAVATKYNALASLSNIPIWYMTLVAGWASTKYGAVKMLYIDAGSEFVGIALLLIVIAIVRPGKERVADAPTLPEARIINESTDR
jgi:MFS transporter, PAT family, beta-lactamase induction signal transducer AmpG